MNAIRYHGGLRVALKVGSEPRRSTNTLHIHLIRPTQCDNAAFAMATWLSLCLTR